MRTPETPHSCQSCGANFHERGSVIAWRELPHRLVGHIIPGEGDGVIFMADVSPDDLPLKLECSSCSEGINERVEEICLDPECQIKEAPEG